MRSALDTSVPNMARIDNYLPGGKDHFAADGAQADTMVQLYPPLPVLAREKRAFLLQAFRWQPGRASGSSSTWAPGSGVPAGPPGGAGGAARSPGGPHRQRPLQVGLCTRIQLDAPDAMGPAGQNPWITFLRVCLPISPCV
jgi:hypothetical protein